MNRILNFKAFESQSFQNKSGETFWGDRGAGVLPICPSTGKILVAYRSADVNEPHTWGIFGGMIDEDETPHEAARRELEEESGYSGKFKIIPAHIYRSPKGGFTYFNFLGIVDSEFQAEFDWETENAKWMTLDELEKLKPKHFGLVELLKHSMKEIREAVEMKAEKLQFHHSDAPDAKGRFRDLPVKKLAKWLVRTRKGDMRKITGSLNQQINFNKKEDPGYAAKMEKTRAEVKKLLKMDESFATNSLMLDLLRKVFEKKEIEMDFETMYKLTLTALDRNLIKLSGAPLLFYGMQNGEGIDDLQNNTKLINVSDFKKVCNSFLWRAVVKDGYKPKATREDIFSDEIFKLTPTGKNFLKDPENIERHSKYQDAKSLGLIESVDKPYEIKSESFWKSILAGNKKALEILEIVMKKQGGFASHRQIEVLNRAKRGDKSPYHTKN